MTEQRRPGRYPAELRDRAGRMVFEAEQHTESRWEAICSVAEKLGPTAETVRKWVARVEIDEGGGRGGFAAEPICRVLQFAPSAYWSANRRPRSQRSLRDEPGCSLHRRSLM